MLRFDSANHLHLERQPATASSPDRRHLPSFSIDLADESMRPNLCPGDSISFTPAHSVGHSVDTIKT